MVEKVISGGQTGADQAALDVAIRLGLDYGGWLPKGRMTEAGPLPPRYAAMQEMETKSYARRTVQNVMEADATLIFSHGILTGGSALTAQAARQHLKPFLHFDLTTIGTFQAAEAIRHWLERHQVKALNVAGSRASSDPRIYQGVYDVLTTALTMHLFMPVRPGGSVRLETPGAVSIKTVSEAVAHIIARLDLRRRNRIARLNATECHEQGPEIIARLKAKGFWPETSSRLKTACRQWAGEQQLTATDSHTVIFHALWQALKETHRIRRVK